MPTQRPFPWLLALLAPALPVGAQGTRDLTTISLDELAQTKVTSVSREEEPVFLTPAAISVISADDIRRSGATNLADVLRLAPGVHVARIQSSQWAVGIRGFASRLSRGELALMDGRSLYTTLFAGTYWEAQDTVLEDIDRIEVVRGPGGTLWGANAVNGIINVVTKSAEDTQGGLIAAGGGSEERAFIRARYGSRLGQDGHYRVYGKYFDRDAGFHADGDDFDDWHMAQGGFRADWNFPSSDRLTVQGDAYSGRAGQRASLSFYEPPFSRTVETNAELSGGNLTTRWDHRLGDSTLTLRAYYDRTRRMEPSFQEVRDTGDFEVQNQVGIGGRHEIVFGLGYRLSSGRSSGIETVAFVPANRTDHIFSAFVQDRFDLAKDRLQLGIGTKVERNQYTGFELQPSARLAWSPSARQAVWAAVTRAVRTPSRLERDLALTAALSPSMPIFARLLGNDDFVSERTVAFEAGYRVRPTERLSLDVSVFHNRYSRLVSLETGAPFLEDGRQILPFRLGNGLGGHGSGFELASLARLSGSWAITAVYSYLSMELAAEPGSTDRTSAAADEASPRHATRVQSEWRLPANVDLDVAFRWVGAASADVPAYAALNARVAWPVVAKLELAVVGQNLLHQHHLEFGGTNPVEVQRSVYGEARWRF